MTKNQRQARSYLNPAEMARHLCIPRVTLDYHLRQQYIPAPKTRIGQRLYFDPVQVKTITSYFRARSRYQHQTDVFDK